MKKITFHKIEVVLGRLEQFMIDHKMFKGELLQTLIIKLKQKIY